jgi:hypothetical protein
MKMTGARYIISAVNTKDRELVEKHGVLKMKYNLTNEDIVRAGVKHYEEKGINDITQNNNA